MEILNHLEDHHYRAVRDMRIRGRVENFPHNPEHPGTDPFTSITLRVGDVESTTFIHTREAAQEMARVLRAIAERLDDAEQGHLPQLIARIGADGQQTLRD